MDQKPEPAEIELNLVDDAQTRQTVYDPSDAFILFTFNKPPREVIRFNVNGDIYVNGQLTTNNLEVVEAMRLFLHESGTCKLPMSLVDSIKLVTRELGRLYPGEPTPELQKALQTLDRFCYGK